MRLQKSALLLSVVTLAAWPLSSKGEEPEDSTETMDCGGQERVYHLHAPTDGTRPAPLVIALHGGHGTGDRMNENLTRGTLNREADARGFFVVYPDGIGKKWNDGRPSRFRRAEEEVDDVAFISALIDRLVKEHPIDRARVYVTGISNGGMMSYRLACDLPEKIAAIAAVTAGLPEGLAERKPSKPVAVLILNGTADPLMPFEGGEIREGRLIGKTCRDMDASREIFSFFAKHSRVPSPASGR